MYQRNRVLFIHMPLFNQLEFNSIVMKKILMIIIKVILGIKTMMILINILKDWVCKNYFQMNQNPLQES